MNEQIYKRIRKPVPPPTKRFKTGKEYSRAQNNLKIDSYLEEHEEPEGGDTVGQRQGQRERRGRQVLIPDEAQ